jgi:uncharacterized protein (DUF2126 family)
VAQPVQGIAVSEASGELAEPLAHRVAAHWVPAGLVHREQIGVVG